MQTKSLVFHKMCPQRVLTGVENMEQLSQNIREHEGGFKNIHGM